MAPSRMKIYFDVGAQRAVPLQRQQPMVAFDSISQYVADEIYFLRNGHAGGGTLGA